MPGPNGTLSDAELPFICTQYPGDRTARRVARSYAVAKGLQKKRNARQRMGLNFLAVTFKDGHKRQAKQKKGDKDLVGPLFSLSMSLPSPFQMLSAEVPILAGLLNRHKAQGATEPIFSMSDELVLQNLYATFQKGLHDGALVSAFMLTSAFALNLDSLDLDCLRYQSEAFGFIRENMNSPDKAATESTLGAMLLLAGVEARLGMPLQVQLHMGAIHRVLEVCQRKAVHLSDGIKRAIFWSDLNCSVMSGSSRVVDHSTFSELQWRRDSLPTSSFILPHGFRSLSHLLDEEFTEVLRDLFALQCIRESDILGIEDVIPMAEIDDHQASIQSRLVDLPSISSFSESCYLGAYLCSAMLRCKLWRTSTIPSHLSSQLLHKLQEASDDPQWDDAADLLLWLLHIGGAFSPIGEIRSGYVQLLHLNRTTRPKDSVTSWPELLKVMKQFIWSEKAFLSQVKAFWEETCL